MDLTNVTINEEATHGEHKTPAKDVFCGHWNQTRTGLEAIHEMVKNPLVKIILTAVIGLGNSLQSRFCKG